MGNKVAIANGGGGMAERDPAPVTTAIRARLAASLSPIRIGLIDDSARHAGHAGARPEGQSHFRVTVVAAAFAGLTRLERQRLVYRALGELMVSDIHALSVRALTPEEAAA
jgi:BolA protein